MDHHPDACRRCGSLLAGDEISTPTGNAGGNNPSGKRGWPWVMVTAVVRVFIQGLSRSTAAAIELLGAPDPRSGRHR